MLLLLGKTQTVDEKIPTHLFPIFHAGKTEKKGTKSNTDMYLFFLEETHLNSTIFDDY